MSPHLQTDASEFAPGEHESGSTTVANQRIPVYEPEHSDCRQGRPFRFIPDNPVGNAATVITVAGRHFPERLLLFVPTKYNPHG